jgi:YVTN family beta-propeller protein
MVRASAVAALVVLATLLFGVGGAGAPDHSAPAAATADAPQVGAQHEWPAGYDHATPAGSAMASVIDTLNLVTNQLLPGNQLPVTQTEPQMVLYDAANGDLYVRGDDGQAISVVNASNEEVLTGVEVGTAGSAYVPNVPTMALDTTNGDLFEGNAIDETIGVISTASNLLTGTIKLGAVPGGIVFDPANGDLYTTNWESDNVSVVSGTTEKVVASIPVGGEPGAILYDPNDREVYVSNFDSGNVSVINTTSESVVANPGTGVRTAEPLALTLNTRDDLVNVVNSLTNNLSVINGTTYAVQSVAVGTVPTSAIYVASTDRLLVVNGASDNVTVLQQPADTVVATLDIGHGAQGAEYDPVNGYVYTANYGSDNVSVLDASTDTVQATVTTTNYPETLAVDTSSGDVFVANEGTFDIDANLTVISGSTSDPIGSIRLNAYPTGLSTTPGGALFSSDSGGQGVDLLSTATNLRTAFDPTAPVPGPSAYDPITGDVYVASEPSGAVTVLTSSGTFVASVALLGYGSAGVAFDPANGQIYVSNADTGNITLIDGTTHAVDRVIVVKPYDTLGAEIYDPATSSMYVADYSSHNVTVVTGNVTNGSIQVGTYPSSFAYDPQNGTVFVSNYGSNNISVVNASTDQEAGAFSAYYPEFLAYDPVNGSLYTASAENPQVAGYNATSYASLGTPVDINGSGRAGGIVYSATSGDLYVSNVYDGSIAILSGVPLATYPVTFTESGLPATTPWNVTLEGVTKGSASASIGFVEPAGSYSYTVGAVTGYSASPNGGEFTLASPGKTITITFTAPLPKGESAVDFHEQGLPATTSWSVALAGVTLPSTTPYVNFSESNGSYTYTVDPVSGFSSAPSSGPVTVAGMNQTLTINFTAGVSPLSVTLVANPSTFTLNNTTVLTATVSGGTAPYSLVYTGLPSGCATENTTALTCKPTGTGTFTVKVTVTDHARGTAEANATVTVQASGGKGTSPGSQGGSSSPPWGWIAGGAALLVLLLLLLLLFVLARRRRNKDPPASSPSARANPPSSAGP